MHLTINEEEIKGMIEESLERRGINLEIEDIEFDFEDGEVVASVVIEE